MKDYPKPIQKSIFWTSDPGIDPKRVETLVVQLQEQIKVFGLVAEKYKGQLGVKIVFVSCSSGGMRWISRKKDRHSIVLPISSEESSEELVQTLFGDLKTLQHAMVAINNVANAGILAAEIIAIKDQTLYNRLKKFKRQLRDNVLIQSIKLLKNQRKSL